MTAQLLPSAVRVLSEYLRSTDDVTDLVGQRVYTAVPSKPEFPLVRLTRVGGSPVQTTSVLWLDVATIQVDVFGGSKHDVDVITATIRAAIDEMPAHTHDGAVVTAVRFGPLNDLPDPAYEPARQRSAFDVDLYLHPGPEVGS